MRRMGRTPKSKNAKSQAEQYATPQPSGAFKRQNRRILQSDPPPKRKKLAEELDDEISDKEFDVQLGKIREREKKKKGKELSNQNSKRCSNNSTSEDESEDDNIEDSDDDKDESVSEESEDNDDEDDVIDDDGDVSSDVVDDDVDSEDDFGSKMMEEDDKDEDSDEDEEDEDYSADGSEDNEEDDSMFILENQQKETKTDLAKKQKQSINKDKKIEEICHIEAAEMMKDLLAKASRDNRTLFIKSLPKSVTIKEIQALSTDIAEVRMHICKDRRGKDLKCAYVEFVDEATAIKNKSSLEDKEINNQKISVDFVGEKSAFKKTVAHPSGSLDPRKLYVSGFGNNVSTEDLSKLFPSASSIDLPCYKKENCPKGFAFIHFDEEKTCKVAHASMQNQSLNGKLLTVMYAKYYKARKPKKNKRKKGGKLLVNAAKSDDKGKSEINISEKKKKKSRI